MYRLIDVYNATEKERNHFFLLFKELDKEVWHAKLGEELWSSENIFRHLLASLQHLKTVIPNVEFEDSTLGIQYRQAARGKYSIEEVENEFHRITPKIKAGIESLSEAEEDEELETGFGLGKMHRSHLIEGLMMHEHSHFGQVTTPLKE